jgi:flagellar biosynthesis/type III secretory pathway chaperone
MFEQRQHCVAALLELARRQQVLVAEADYPNLLSLLGAKQRLIAQLAELGRKQSEFRDVWIARERLLPAELRRRCEELLNQTEALFEDLLKCEREATESLSAQRDQTKTQLQSVAQGSRANQAYLDSLAPFTHRLLDLDQ